MVPVQNPFNPRHIREVDLSPSAVDGIVFWTKNPRPMMGRLDALGPYAFYFQFTLNAYHEDIEPGLPSKERLRETFLRLSDAVGPDRVIWRYDPVLLNDTYTVSWHIDRFGETAERLRGYTKRVVFSFIDLYKKIERAVKLFGIREADDDDRDALAARFAAAARQNGLSIETCAEAVDLSRHGITHGHCVDQALLSAIRGRPLTAGTDKNQRPSCGCAPSVDIGAYQSCRNGCVYCYATTA
jgi:DNA repair photolyase